MKVRPEEVFLKHGGQLRMSDAIRHGITRYMLYSLRDKGRIKQVSRGIYRLVELPTITNPDLVTVSLRFPGAIVCLVSALAYHDITSQIPHEVSVALPRKSRIHILAHPPIQVHRFSKKAYMSGIVEHSVDGVSIKVYNPEKTLADCFKYRNKIGMDIVLEALKFYKARKKFNPSKLIEYAKICRVQEVMRPYLEATMALS